MTHVKNQMSRAATLYGAGSWVSAVAVYEEVFKQAAVESRVDDLLEATRRIGYAYQWAGEIHLAIEYLELACTLADLHNQGGSAARALNGLGTVYQNSGSIELAARAYESAKVRARQAGDTLAAGDIEQNLGTLATIRGDHTAAITHFRASRSYYTSINHERGLAQVHNCEVWLR